MYIIIISKVPLFTRETRGYRVFTHRAHNAHSHERLLMTENYTGIYWKAAFY